MAGGGGKGSSTSTQKMELPPWMEDAFKKGLSLSEERAKMGYVPHMGPDVAAFSQPQMQSMQNSADTANLWGMGPDIDIQSQIPQPQDFGGGLRGYSSFPLFDQTSNALGDKYPGLKGYLDSFFIDPVSGQMQPNNPWDRANAALSTRGRSRDDDDDGDSYSRGRNTAGGQGGPNR